MDMIAAVFVLWTCIIVPFQIGFEWWISPEWVGTMSTVIDYFFIIGPPPPPLPLSLPLSLSPPLSLPPLSPFSPASTPPLPPPRTDIFANFRTAYIEHGELFTDSKKIRNHYLKTWFLPDLISVIPYELFFGASSSTRKSFKLAKLQKTPK
jgi:hypothetical protein